jgi:hypothetical protein
MLFDCHVKGGTDILKKFKVAGRNSLQQLFEMLGGQMLF